MSTTTTSQCLILLTVQQLKCRYNIVLFLVTYLLPMVGMMLCYLQMGFHLWHGDTSTTISSMTAHPALIKSRQNKKRVRVFCFHNFV